MANPNKEVLFALSWFLTSLTLFTFASLMLIYLSFTRLVPEIANPHYQIYQALPAAEIIQQEVNIDTADARSVIVADFLKFHKSPLAKYAAELVTAADKYKLDFRLLPAISMQESNGGKIMPQNSYNPFGYGIYGGKVVRFGSWEEAIERVGRGLREDYLDQGLKTPHDIMTKYTPPSLKKGNAWAIGVSAFIEQMN